MALALVVAIVPLLLIVALAVAVHHLHPHRESDGAVRCAAAPVAPATAPQLSRPTSPVLADPLWRATIHTNCGRIEVQLDGREAPQTVAAFVFLARHDYWRDDPCHPITTDPAGSLLLQCGDPIRTGAGYPGYRTGPENAPASGDYPRGTIAMAPVDDSTRNAGRFVIFARDTELPLRGGGYSIFGKVTDGMDVIDAVAAGADQDAQPDSHPDLSISILSVSVAEER